MGDGIPPISEWQLDQPTYFGDMPDLHSLDRDDEVKNTFSRLRAVLHRTQYIPLPTTRLHDLTCFVLHRLLPPNLRNTAGSQSSALSDSLRYAMILYMLIIQGPTYYSHEALKAMCATRLMESLQQLHSASWIYCSLDIWLIAIGMVASEERCRVPHVRRMIPKWATWFTERAHTTATCLDLVDTDDALSRMKMIMWIENPQGEKRFRSHWEVVFSTAYDPAL
jgi:hypothetical protein